MTRVLLVLSVVALVGCAGKQPPLLPAYLATKTPYQPQTFALSATPAGCRPVHIEGVFRHGSRHLNDAKDIERLISILEAEKATSTLTSQRQNALAWAYEARREFRAGLLTKQGERELYEMGTRIGKTYRNLFDDNEAVVEMVSAPKERTKVSLEQFRAGLLSVSPVRIQVQPTDQNVLRYFAHCKNYQAYKKAKMKSLPKTDFGFAKSLYALCQQDYNIDQTRADEHFCSLLTPDMKRALYEKSRAKSYYKFGPPADSGMACILLEPIFTRMQNVVSKNASPVAHFAFGHAETVVPLGNFFELFDLPEEKWDPSQVAPMAVNFQMITYECSSGDEKSYKVKLLYNEKEYSFRAPQCFASPYCDWNVVKSYYEKRKQELGVKSCSEADWNQYCGNNARESMVE